MQHIKEYNTWIKESVLTEAKSMSLDKAVELQANIVKDLKANLLKIKSAKTPEERQKWIDVAKDLTAQKKDSDYYLNAAIKKLDRNVELEIDESLITEAKIKNVIPLKGSGVIGPLDWFRLTFPNGKEFEVNSNEIDARFNLNVKQLSIDKIKNELIGKQWNDKINEEIYDFLRDLKNALGNSATADEVEEYLGGELNSYEESELRKAGFLRGYSSGKAKKSIATFTSSDGKKNYQVSTNRGRYECECPAYQYSKGRKDCKHIKLVKKGARGIQD